MFEYPVYKEDIGPKGFEIVSLGDPKAYARVTKLNAELGGHHFGPHVLKDHLTNSLDWACPQPQNQE